MKGTQIFNGQNQIKPYGFHEKHVSTLLAQEDEQQSIPGLTGMAKLFMQVKKIPGIWQFMVFEILEVDNMNIRALANQLDVSQRTVKRILSNNTKTPSLKTCFQLFTMHAQLRPERYLEKEGGDIDLELH